MDEKELDRTPSFHGLQIQSHRIFLKMSIYIIMLDEVIDLLGNSKKMMYKDQEGSKTPAVEHYLDQGTNTVVSRLVNLQERVVMCPQDFFSAVADAFRSRKELGLNKFQDKDLRKKSHFVINFNLVQ